MPFFILYLIVSFFFAHSLNQGNILVDDGGNARISDFGRAKFVGDRISFSGTTRWVAPEILLDTDSLEETDDNQSWNPQATKHTDIYALGMILLEVRC